MTDSKAKHVRIPWVKSVEDLERLQQWRASERAKDVTPSEDKGCRESTDQN